MTIRAYHGQLTHAEALSLGCTCLWHGHEYIDRFDPEHCPILIETVKAMKTWTRQ